MLEGVGMAGFGNLSGKEKRAEQLKLVHFLLDKSFKKLFADLSFQS